MNFKQAAGYANQARGAYEKGIKNGLAGDGDMLAVVAYRTGEEKKRPFISIRAAHSYTLSIMRRLAGVSKRIRGWG